MLAEMSEKQSAGFVTEHEFREALGNKVGRYTVLKELKAGNIKHVRFGRKTLILASEISDWPKRAAEATQ